MWSQRIRGVWQPTTWREWLAISRDVAYALHAIGFRPGDVASIMSNAVPEWVHADMGVLCAGGVSSGIYDPDKLLWMNGVYIRQLSLDELVRRTIPYMKRPEAEGGLPDNIQRPLDVAYTTRVLQLEHERLKTLGEAAHVVSFFYEQEISYDTALLIQKGMEYSMEHMFKELMSFNLASLGYDFKIPFFIFQGEGDILTPVATARAYFDRIQAPHKEFVLIQHAGHLAEFGSEVRGLQGELLNGLHRGLHFVGHAGIEPAGGFLAFEEDAETAGRVSVDLDGVPAG